MSTTENINERIQTLILAFLDNSITREELKTLKEWLKNNDENLGYFSQVRAAWYLSDRNQADLSIDTDKLWLSIRDRMKLPGIYGEKKKTYHSTSFPVYRMAAVWVLFLLAGTFLGYYIPAPKGPATEISQVTVPIGSRSQVQLPDGSMVWLNAGSTLKYGNDLNGKIRKVELSGEGFFKVAHDPSRPFVVEANQLFVRALGTTFNVKAYPEENRIITTLVEGKIKLEGKINKAGPFELTMEPNQKITYYPSSNSFSKNVQPPEIAEKEEVDELHEKPVLVVANTVYKTNHVNTAIYTSWKDKKWIIEGETLGDLAVMLDRRYDVEIVFTSEDLKRYHFSGIIANETLEQVLDILRLTVPMSYKMKKGEVELSLDPELQKKYESAYK